jgi:hypothetical protein
VKILNIIILSIVALLSIAAGAAKLMLVPEEVAFLQEFGIGTNLMLLYGTIQAVSGVLSFIPKTKRIGLTLAAIAFTGSSVLIFFSGNIKFGVVSLVPVILTIFVLYRAQLTVDSTKKEKL